MGLQGAKRIANNGYGVDTIAQATHERFIIQHDKFSEKARVNTQMAGSGMR